MSRRSGAAVFTCALLLFSPAVPVLAAPSPAPGPTAASSAPASSARARDVLARQAELTAKYEAAQASLDAAVAEVGLATEAFNHARSRQQAARTALAAAGKKADRAMLASARASGRVNQLAASLYMQGGDLSGWEFILGVRSAEQLIRRAAGVDAVETHRAGIASRAAEAAMAAAKAKRAAAQAELKARTAAAQAQSARTRAEAVVTAATARTAALEREQQALLTELADLRNSSVEAEMARLIASGESAARAQLKVQAAASTHTAPAPAVNRKGAAVAIAFAKLQLGEPYLWGGEGPARWDCSGLTMKAWAAAGVPLTHYTVSQWEQTARVPLGQLKPGDLVFFAKDKSDISTIHHVGLYVGGGRMIEAPRTGMNVKYSSIYRASLMPYGGRVG